MTESEETLPESDLGSERFWKTQGTLDLETPSAVDSDNPEDIEEQAEGTSDQNQ